MVHNLPENFNISDFDVFHSALLCMAPGTALAVAADRSFCLHASLTALLPGRVGRVELCRGENIIETAVQNDFLLKGSVTMNNEFSASLWQFFCLLRSILLSNLVVPRPPRKSVRITNVFVDRNTADDICYANQSAQAKERSQKLLGPHSALDWLIPPPTACLLAQLPGVLR